MRPLAALVVVLVDLSVGLAWVAKINRFHFVGLDDHDTKVLSCGWVVQIWHLLPKLEMLLIIGLVDWLSWRRIGECT